MDERDHGDHLDHRGSAVVVVAGEIQSGGSAAVGDVGGLCGQIGGGGRKSDRSGGRDSGVSADPAVRCGGLPDSGGIHLVRHRQAGLRRADLAAGGVGFGVLLLAGAAWLHAADYFFTDWARNCHLQQSRRRDRQWLGRICAHQPDRPRGHLAGHQRGLSGGGDPADRPATGAFHQGVLALGAG